MRRVAMTPDRSDGLVGQIEWSKARYRLLRDRGMKHHAAIRKIARSWIRILFRVWKTRVPFDCDRYIANLKQRCPETVPYLAQEN